tara:strand:+ start:63 stop:443 length:381 start_codon:yes stop_codon:yes gene_type:complete
MVNRKNSRKNSRKKLIDDFKLESLKIESRKKDEKQIKKDFKKIDSDNNGFIDLHELRNGLKKYGINMTIKETKKLISKYDNNPDQKIDLQEFIQLKKDIDEKDFRNTRKYRKRKSRKRKSRKRKYR